MPPCAPTAGLYIRQCISLLPSLASTAGLQVPQCVLVCFPWHVLLPLGCRGPKEALCSGDSGADLQLMVGKWNSLIDWVTEVRGPEDAGRA
eukprot:989257-Pelagomonas_calceolata.AAC.1